MRHVRLNLAILLFLGLAACQPTGVAPSSTVPVTYTGKLPQPSPIKLQQITEGGDYVHSHTGLILPERVGALQRKVIVVSTENADDVGGNYMIPGRTDYLATAMVFPIWNVVDRPLTVDDVPMACEDGYRDAREVAQRRLTNARIVKEEAIASPGFPDAVFTRVVVFEADGGLNLADVPIRSEIHWQCGIDKVWVVEHRISYIPDLADAASLTQSIVDGAPKRP